MMKEDGFDLMCLQDDPPRILHLHGEEKGGGSISTNIICNHHWRVANAKWHTTYVWSVFFFPPDIYIIISI